MEQVARMDELQIRKAIPIVALFLSALVFATAPPLLFFLRAESEHLTRRTVLIQCCQSVWLLFCNVLCGLVSYGYCTARFGEYPGIVITVIITAFGGTAAFGAFEYVFTKRLAIGRSLVNRVLTKKGDTGDA